MDLPDVSPTKTSDSYLGSGICCIPFDVGVEDIENACDAVKAALFDARAGNYFGEVVALQPVRVMMVVLSGAADTHPSQLVNFEDLFKRV